MTENDYIDATNIARLRIVREILRDFTSRGLCRDDIDVNVALVSVLDAIDRHESRLGSEVK